MVFDCVRAAWTVQEVFLRAMAEGRRFCELSAPQAWLFRVAHNALVDSTRRRRPSAVLSLDLMGS